MLNFRTKREKTAKSVEEAKELLLQDFGLLEDELEITVVDEGTKGFLGLGSKEAKVCGEVKDVVSFKAKTFLASIFEGMKLDVDIKTTFDGDALLIDLSGDSMGIIIGKRGDTLDSLQYLTSLVVNHGNDGYVKVTLDTENYREKRHEALVALGNRLAQKVIKSGKKYTLEPMNPYERRIIHASLQDNEGVTTFSVGEEPYRKIVIAPKNPVKTSYVPRTSYSSAVRKYPQSQPKKHTDFESYIQSNMSIDEDEE